MADIRNLFSSEYIAKVINADSAFPGGVLGPHLTDSGFVVTVYNPHATEITVVDKRNGKKFTAEKVDEAGLFTAFLGCDTTTPYHLEVNTGEEEDVEVVELEKVTEEDEDGVEKEIEIEVTKTVKRPKPPIQVEDPYRFPVQTSSVDAYLFGTDEPFLNPVGPTGGMGGGNDNIASIRAAMGLPAEKK